MLSYTFNIPSRMVGRRGGEDAYHDDMARGQLGQCRSYFEDGGSVDVVGDDTWGKPVACGFAVYAIAGLIFVP